MRNSLKIDTRKARSRFKIKFWSAGILFFFLCLNSVIYAQSKSSEIKKTTKIEKIEGVKYYMHTVEAGQTIYSIAKAYDVNSKDIIFENPEVVDGLSLNQVIKIPYKEIKKSTSANPVKPATSAAPVFLSHTVEKQQTLYSIAKLYNLTPEELTLANPEVAAGLKIGQVLKIPQNKNAALPSTDNHQDIAHDRLPESPEMNIALTKSFSVALLLPFNSSDIDTNRFQKNLKTSIPSKSYAAIEFYEGFLTAVDSIVKKGIQIKIHVFDAPNDSSKMVQLLEKPELKKMDLLIGPFHNLPAKLTANFAKRNHIPNIIPFTQQNKLLLGNKYAVKVSASSSTQIETVADFITKNYKNQNVLVLHNGLVKERSSVQVFKQKANASLGKDSVNEVIYKTSGVRGLQAKLSPTKENVIFIPSNDQAFVTSLINSLRGLNRNFQIVLVGMESWISFDNLDINTIQDLQLHLPASSSINYGDATVIEMMKKYRKKYKTDPTKYAFQGYDCGIYFLSAMAKSGKEFYLTLPTFKANGLQTNFQFLETAVESGYENKSVFILKYKDFTLTPIK
jgi:LysM repeat protein/ABC-type branched-subunit amino acid transport system substrate-binding protein